MLAMRTSLLVIVSTLLFSACAPDPRGIGASVGDFVWIDSNQNGIQDLNEKGLADVGVFLKEVNGSGDIDEILQYDIDDDEIPTTQTDEHGKYIIGTVYPGNYRLVFRIYTPDYTFTFPNQGDEDYLDSDVVEWTTYTDSNGVSQGWTDVFTTTEGEHHHLDVGIIPVIDGVATATPVGRVTVPTVETPDPDFEFFAPLVFALSQEDFISQDVIIQLQEESESDEGCCNVVLNTPEDQEKEAFAHTDILHRIALQLESSQPVVDDWFGLTDFPCGPGDYGYTICGAKPFTPGRGVMVLAKFDGEIPLEDPTNIYQYGFVFDRDGDSANNYKATPPFAGDFFDDTDLWYELAYSPGRGWELITTDVLAGYAQVSSGARAIISEDTIMLLIPEEELDPENVLFRVTAFRHTGDFGFNPPYDWDGDVDPSVHEPLLEISDVVIEVPETGQAMEMEVTQTPLPDLEMETEVPTTPAPDPEMVGQFYAAFNTAQRLGYADVMYDLLHPAALELYGVEACRTYIEENINQSVLVEVLEVTDFGDWTWEIDGRAVSIEEAFTAEVTVQTDQGTAEQTMHVALRPDGSIGWFTDCGDPLE